jgi:hypothetical protein
MSHDHNNHKETSKPETSNSDSQKADDNERDEDDKQPVRTNLIHQFSIQDADEILHDQGHDEDEQATTVDKRRERFLVHHLKELFETKLGAKHFDYGQTTATIVRSEKNNFDFYL